MGIAAITDDLIAAGIYGAYPREATAGDFNYWNGKKQELYDRGVELNYRGYLHAGDPGVDYFFDRLIGQGAGGADAPTFGPFATPPSPLRVKQATAPEPQPTPTPTPTPAPEVLSTELRDLIDAIDLASTNIAALQDDVRALSARLDTLAHNGIRVHL
jgi:hypothetical protein